jgi:uncharacterized membrane protein YhaH (DUF805 family)
MSFGKAIISGYRNTFNFTGKASVEEYWWFIAWELTLAIAMGVAILIDYLIVGIDGPIWTLYVSEGIPGLATVVTIFPILTAQIRRVRDAGRSGLWVVVSLAMLAAAVALASKNSIKAATLCFLVQGVLSLFILVWTVLPSRTVNDS